MIHTTHNTQHTIHNTLHIQITLNTWYADTLHITHDTHNIWYTLHNTSYTDTDTHNTLDQTQIGNLCKIWQRSHTHFSTHFVPIFSQFVNHLYYWGWRHSNKHWTFESCFYCFRLYLTVYYKHFWQLHFLLARIDMTWGLFQEDNRYPQQPQHF